MRRTAMDRADGPTARVDSHRLRGVIPAMVVGLAGVVSTIGCASAARPIFETPAPRLVWPPAPETARIEFVGEIRTSADLKAPRSGWQSLGDFLIGKKAADAFYGPRAVVVTEDGAGVWVADPGGRCLHRFDLRRRTYLKLRGTGSDSFLTPVGLCIGPDQSLYVFDSERSAVHQIHDGDGRLIRSLRAPDELLRPVAGWFDESANELFVVDAAGHDVKVLAEDGTLLRIVGRRGTTAGEFNFPTAIASDGERLWIADTGNCRVQAIGRSGEPLAMFGQAGDATGDLAMPKGTALDRDGHVYVVDGRFENVQVFDPQGQLLVFFGEEGTGRGQFWLPGGIFIEPNGRIWVCDTYNRRLQVFQYVGEPSE